MDYYTFITNIGFVAPGETDVVAPTAPSDLIDNGSTPTVASLAWTNNDTYDTVRIEQKLGAGSFSEVDSIAGETNFWDSPELAAGTYYFRVRGETGGVFSDYSNTLEVIIAGA